MTLTLRSQDDASGVVACDERGVLNVEGEHRWAVEGPARLIERAHEDLRGVSKRVHSEVLHLNFKNAVGVFRVRDLGVIEVVSGKWEMAHFDSMLAEIASIASGLPFAAGTHGPLPYDRTLSTRDDLLYHSYVYVRHILSPRSPQHVQLMPMLRTILAEPHRRAVTRTVDVPVERLQRIDAATLLAVASGRGPFIRWENRERVLPPVLDGHLPCVLPEKQFQTTVDTPENRFVKAFLGLIGGVLARMKDVCINGENPFAHRIRAECIALEDVLAPVVRHPLWRLVAGMTHLPANSTVLHRRRGYRQVFRHFILLRLAARHLPISAHQTRDLLEGKDIATLYELWCYFKVVEVLRQILGEPSKVADVHRDELRVQVAREFEVQWANGVRALYNATFSRSRTGDRFSYSVPLRPDIVIILPDGGVHLLDAKFKLAWREVGEEDLDRSDVKLEDVHKMHAYRDAIDAARSAWVLYPGSEPCEFRADGGCGAELNGVGAIPLRPESGGALALEQVLRRMLA